VDCYADIPLVGLILRGTDVGTVRVGWKFTPRGNPIADESMITSDEPWDLLASERLCHPEESQLCEGDGGVRAEGSTTAGRVLGSWDLDTVLHEATNHVWKARWLRVTPETAFGSGTWQCWLEGPNLFKNKTIRERKNKSSTIFRDFSGSGLDVPANPPAFCSMEGEYEMRNNVLAGKVMEISQSGLWSAV
ncbi:hypothetical protein TSMEX_004071, partial [Taenia solium]